MNSDSVYIIAEAGVNHNGSLEMALRLVDAAKASGADVIKFQTFNPEKLVSRFAGMADYQKKNTGTDESQLSMLRRLALSVEDHALIIDRCVAQGIQFMSSPFDHESLALLVERFAVPAIKLGSGEITNAPLLLAVAQTGKPLILSTGMATLDEVQDALGVLAFGYLGLQSPSVEAFKQAFATQEGKQLLFEKVTLLHCTTEYPAPVNEVNLRAMDTLADTFGLTTGYSDHTEGWVMPVAAVARGAKVIEKHFTLDRTLPGPDHKASLNPAELSAMVQAIRQVESGLGNGKKIPAASELKNIAIARKSVVASDRIAAGEVFSMRNIAVKRPGTGISPFRYWELLGQPSLRDYDYDQVIAD